MIHQQPPNHPNLHCCFRCLASPCNTNIPKNQRYPPKTKHFGIIIKNVWFSKRILSFCWYGQNAETVFPRRSIFEWYYYKPDIMLHYAKLEYTRGRTIQTRKRDLERYNKTANHTLCVREENVLGDAKTPCNFNMKRWLMRNSHSEISQVLYT